MQIAMGAWGALEAVASDSCGRGVAPASATGGGGRHRKTKTVDTARDLLTLPYVDAKPVDLVTCYERCGRVAPVAGEGAAVGAVEVRVRVHFAARVDGGVLVGRASLVM